MRNLGSFAASIALVLAACSLDEPVHDQGGGRDSRGHDAGAEDSGSDGGPGEACTLGAPTFTALLGASDAQQRTNLAVDANGGVLVGAAGLVSGVRTISSAGAVLASLPYGSHVAIGANGNVFIAGTFSAPLELGGGVVLAPLANADVFLVELDANGAVVLAKAFGHCGGTVEALAVAADGRVAISGSVLGTIVLDASGAIVLERAGAGELAFTSQGNLVIAGSGDAPSVTEIDAAGAVVFAHELAGSATLSGVAVDANDRIAVVGTTESSIDLLGTIVTATYSDGVRSSGAFALQLGAAGDRELATPAYIAFVNGVVFGPDGLAYIAATTQGFVGPDVERSGQLLRIDSGTSVTSFGSASLFRGGYDSIGVDACGSLILGGAGYQDPTDPTVNAVVMKVAI